MDCAGLRRIRAAREVVLSAGAIGSPQILMLSGVGRPEDLKSAGVEPLVASSGMGRNLQDHLQARPVYKCNAPTINSETRSLFRKGVMALQFAVSRTGPMTMAASGPACSGRNSTDYIIAALHASLLSHMAMQ